MPNLFRHLIIPRSYETLKQVQGDIIVPKLSDFFTPHKGGGEAEKPFRAITFNRLNEPSGLFNHHLLGDPLRFIALSFNVSHSKRV